MLNQMLNEDIILQNGPVMLIDLGVKRKCNKTKNIFTHTKKKKKEVS